MGIAAAVHPTGGSAHQTLTFVPGVISLRPCQASFRAPFTPPPPSPAAGPAGGGGESACRQAGQYACRQALLDTSGPLHEEASSSLSSMQPGTTTHQGREGGAAPRGRRATRALWWPSQMPPSPPSAGRVGAPTSGCCGSWVWRLAEPAHCSMCLCAAFLPLPLPLPPAPSQLASATDLRSRCCGLVPPGSGAREVGRTPGAATDGIATAGRRRQRGATGSRDALLVWAAAVGPREQARALTWIPCSFQVEHGTVLDVTHGLVLLCWLSWRGGLGERSCWSSTHKRWSFHPTAAWMPRASSSPLTCFHQASGGPAGTLPMRYAFLSMAPAIEGSPRSGPFTFLQGCSKQALTHPP